MSLANGWSLRIIKSNFKQGLKWEGLFPTPQISRSTLPSNLDSFLQSRNPKKKYLDRNGPPNERPLQLNCLLKLNGPVRNQPRQPKHF